MSLALAYYRPPGMAICDLAAGVDPYNAPSINLGVSTIFQFGPYPACLNRYNPPPPWWLPVFWPVVIAVLGLGLFAVLPRWRTRRRRLVDAGGFDRGGDLKRELEEYRAGTCRALAGDRHGSRGTGHGPAVRPLSVSGTRQLLAQEFGVHPAVVSTASVWSTIAHAVLADFFVLPLAPCRRCGACC